MDTWWSPFIPVIGFIFGAAATFTATWLTNKSNQQRHAQTLEHERNLKRESRTFDAKRAAFVKVAESTSLYYIFLANALERSFSEVTNTPFAGQFVAAHAELQIYCSVETTIASQNLSREMALLTASFAKNKARLLEVESDLASIDSEIKNYERRNEQYRAEVQVLLGNRAANEAQIYATRAAIAKHYQLIADAHGRTQPLHDKKAKLLLECARDYGADVMKISPAMTAMIIAARRELGMPVQAKLIESLMGANLAAAEELMKNMHALTGEMIEGGKPTNA